MGFFDRRPTDVVTQFPPPPDPALRADSPEPQTAKAQVIAFFPTPSGRPENCPFTTAPTNFPQSWQSAAMPSTGLAPNLREQPLGVHQGKIIGKGSPLTVNRVSGWMRLPSAV